MIQSTGKRELNKARRRCGIIDVATRAFFDKGYGATSMSAIADELGGSKATLWSHFSSKEDLFVAVVDAEVASFSEEIDDVLIGRTYSREALRRFCLRFIELLLRPNSVKLFRLIIAEGPRFPEITEAFYARGPMKLRKAVAEFYATRFDACEAEILTQLTVSTLLGFRSDALIRPVPPSRKDAEDFVDQFITHLRLPDLPNETA